MERNLFKAKRVSDDKWVEGYAVGNDWILGDIDDWDNDYVTPEFWAKIKPETLSQYTGIKDSKGNKIFEGDIVKHTRTNMHEPTASFHGKDITHISKIIYDEKVAAFKSTGRWNKGGGWSSGLSFNDDRADENIVEVIGNTHDAGMDGIHEQN